MGAFLDACRTAVSAVPEVSLRWVSDARLRAAGVDPWMGVPLWIGEDGWSGANRVDTTRGKAAGLTFRPLIETIRDTLAWDLGRGGPPEGQEGLSEQAEARLLAPST